MDKIEQAKQVLAKHGYYVDCLWVTYDVRMNFECTNEEALQVLDKVFKSDDIMETIFDKISLEAQQMNLKPVENE